MAESAPWLIVGLGNPGPQYRSTRHNVGFMAVERWAERQAPAGAPERPWRDKFHGHMTSFTGSFGQAIVLKPQTYMNRSGQSVGAAMAFYRVPADRMLVVHDELDFEFGRVAIKMGGGHGGHNGLRDIIAVTGTRDFVRVRTGVGRPTNTVIEVADWLLSAFDVMETADLPALLDRSALAIEAIILRGYKSAMNEVNQGTRRGTGSSSE